MIAMYDLEDNLLAVFDNYKECANYFGVKPTDIMCHICRFKKGKIHKKRLGNTWVKLFKIEEEEWKKKQYM